MISRKIVCLSLSEIMAYLQIKVRSDLCESYFTKKGNSKVDNGKFKERILENPYFTKYVLLDLR